jgi:hypothetical protein
VRQGYLRLARRERAVTARPVFGEFLAAARDQLPGSARVRGVAGGEGTVQEVINGLLRVVTVMGRYVRDVTAAPGELGSGVRPPLTAWGRAGMDAREALANAASYLEYHSTGRHQPDAAPRGELGGRLEAMSVPLTAGRDLLQTHLARSADGAREFRSEWGLVVSSPPVTRALLGELGELARRMAPACADQVLSPAVPGTSDERRSLNAACQWLWVLAASARAAQRSAPVPASDRELLRAIPVNAPLPRLLPGGSEPVTGLCRGVIISAERARHAAWAASAQDAWSASMTAESLRRAAATGTVTSHHCEILLRSLAARTADGDTGEVSAALLRAADAAGRARAGWLRAATALNRVTADTWRHLSRTPAEGGDLTLWTGRLAYADPRWTLSSGPAQEPRAPQDLAPHARHVPLAVAAVHHACDAMTGLAYAERERVRTAAGAGRILVPVRSLPETMDIPRPFAPAPRDRIDALMSLYEYTGRASAEAAAGAGDAAAAVRAPSCVLTAARAAAEVGREDDPGRAGHAAGGPSADAEHHELPGPVEDVLHGLGVTSRDLLRRGAQIDRAGEQLIIDAAERRGSQHSRPSAATLSRSAGTAALVNHALASGDPRAAALLHRQASARREDPEAEP